MNTLWRIRWAGLCALFFVHGFESVGADCVGAPSGLIGWWRAENTGNDSAGTNTASLSGGTAFTNGFVGRAFAFDGVDDIAYVPASAFASVSNNFTMEMWVYPTAGRGSVGETVSSGTGIGTGQRYAVFPSHGDNSFGAGHAGAGISIGTNGVTVFEHAAFYIPSPLELNVALFGWNHVTVVYSNNQASLYLNGVFARTGLASPRLVHPSGEMGGGAYGNLAGFMDEYAVYDRALSAAEVQGVFAAGSAGKCVPPVLQIRALSGAVRLSWATNTPGYALETNGPSFALAAWSILSSSAVVTGPEFVVTNSINSSLRIYRLKKF